MHKLTLEEMEKEPWRGHGSSSKVFREVLALEVGEVLFIEPQDWGTRKYPPTRVARYIEKKYQRKYEVLHHALKKGWAVKRVK